MSAWVVVLVVGAGSLVIRALPLLASDALRPGRRAEQGLRHAGIGAMTALFVSALVPRGATSTPPDVAVLTALGIASVLAWRRSSMVRVVAVGAAAYVAVACVRMVA